MEVSSSHNPDPDPDPDPDPNPDPNPDPDPDPNPKVLANRPGFPFLGNDFFREVPSP